MTLYPPDQTGAEMQMEKKNKQHRNTEDQSCESTLWLGNFFFVVVVVDDDDFLADKKT